MRQAQRVWRNYREHRLEGLLQSKNKGYFGKISFVEVSHLHRFLLDEQAYTLTDIQAYLSGSLSIEYTIGGVFDLCKRLGIKLKTGRPVYYQQYKDDLEFFKKNCRVKKRFSRSGYFVSSQRRTVTNYGLGHVQIQAASGLLRHTVRIPRFVLGMSLYTYI